MTTASGWRCEPNMTGSANAPSRRKRSIARESSICASETGRTVRKEEPIEGVYPDYGRLSATRYKGSARCSHLFTIAGDEVLIPSVVHCSHSGA
jgi:hypothetical protein